jgi:hypothetical protein
VDTNRLLEHLTELELLLLRPAVRPTPDVISSLLREDFREFGTSGAVYSKAEIVDAFAKEPAGLVGNLEAEGFELVLLENNVALLTYRSTRKTVGMLTPVRSFRSSLWVRCDEKWQMIFHQGTKTA